MKHPFRFFVFLSAVLLLLSPLAISVSAESTPDRYLSPEGFEYYYEDRHFHQAVVVTDYKGDLLVSSLTVPAELGGARVESIYSTLFAKLPNLKTIDFPDTLLEIGGIDPSQWNNPVVRDSANWDGAGLYWDNVLVSVNEKEVGESFSVREGTVLVASGVFKQCENLKKISFPKSYRAFHDKYCSSQRYYFTCPNPYSKTAEEFEVSPENPYYTSVDGILYTKDGKTLVKCPPKKDVRNFTVPDAVEAIAYEAFCETNTETVSFGKNLKTIGPSAFQRTALKGKLILPGTIETIGFHAFYWSENVIETVLEEGVKRIDYGAFNGCSSLERISLPESLIQVGNGIFGGTLYYKKAANWEGNGLYIDGHLVDTWRYSGSDYRSPLIKSFTVKEGTRTIAADSFRYWEEIESITLPDSLVSIGAGAFHHCVSLTSLTLPEGLKYIGDSAFFGCDSILRLSIPKSVIEIFEGSVPTKDYAFCGYTTPILYKCGYLPAEKIDHFILLCHPDSVALDYAEKYGIETWVYGSKKALPEPPATADRSQILFYSLLFLGSGAGLILQIKKKKA